MNARLVSLSAATAIFIAAAAHGADAPATADAIGGRQAAFRLSAATMGAIKAGLAAGVDVKALGFSSGAIAKWAHTMPGMFPAGSDGAPTHALPTVWSDRAGFEKAAGDYAAAADAMTAAAKAGDKDAFTAAFAKTGAACDACHKVYRQPDGH
jgi:cytochrome c556